MWQNLPGCPCPGRGSAFEGWLEGSRGSPCSDYIDFLLDPRLALGGSVVVETMSLLNTLLCLRFPLAVQV